MSVICSFFPMLYLQLLRKLSVIEYQCLDISISKPGSLPFLGKIARDGRGIRNPVPLTPQASGTSVFMQKETRALGKF